MPRAYFDEINAAGGTCLADYPFPGGAILFNQRSQIFHILSFGLVGWLWRYGNLPFVPSDDLLYSGALVQGNVRFYPKSSRKLGHLFMAGFDPGCVETLGILTV